MRAVVPYKRYAIKALGYTPYARPIKKARLAYKLAAGVYNNRHRIARAARVIRRAYKSYQARKAKIGERPGTSASSRHENYQNANFSTRALHSDELILLNRNTTSNQIDQRERDTAVIKGIKICIQLRNFESAPLFCNVAVIHPKTELGVGNDIPVDEFFRAYGQARSQDFSTSLDPMSLHCLPINSDKYVVLRHKRFMIGPAAGFSTGATRTPVRLIDMYVQLNRQIRYTGNSAIDLEEGQVYLAYWFDNPDSTAGSPAVASAIRVNRRYVVYFKNPR